MRVSDCLCVIAGDSILILEILRIGRTNLGSGVIIGYCKILQSVVRGNNQRIGGGRVILAIIHSVTCLGHEAAETVPLHIIVDSFIAEENLKSVPVIVDGDVEFWTHEG